MFDYRSLLCAILALVMPVSAMAQSLADSVRSALVQYPTILAAQAAQASADWDITRAQGAHWPQVAWSGAYSAYNSGNVANNWIQSPTVSVNLWAGGRIESEVNKSRANADGARLNSVVTKDLVALQAVHAYLGWARALELLKVSNENVQAHQKIRSYLMNIVQQDPGRRTDLEQVNARLEGARLLHQQNQASLSAAIERLQRLLLGRLPLHATGMDELYGTVPATLEQAMDFAKDSNPVIAQQIAAVSAAKANVKIAQSQFHPQVNATYGKQTYQGSGQGDYVGQLVVSIPIVQGGTAYGATQAAYASLHAAEYLLQDTKLTLRENLRTAWLNWSTADQRIKTMQAQLEFGRSMLSGYWSQYEIGRRQISDLLNAQSDFYNYRAASVAMRYERLSDRAIVLKHTGQLALSYQRASPDGDRPAVGRNTVSP